MKFLSVKIGISSLSKQYEPDVKKIAIKFCLINLLRAVQWHANFDGYACTAR